MTKDLGIAFGLAVFALIALTSCGDIDQSQRIIRTEAPDARELPEELLDRDPGALTVVDALAPGENTPSSAVFQLLFRAQWGDLPAVAETYTSEVRNAVGDKVIMSAYEFLRFNLVGAQADTIFTCRSGSTAMVGVRFVSRYAEPTVEGFLMERIDGAWRVSYDTLLEQGSSGATSLGRTAAAISSKPGFAKNTPTDSPCR